MMIRINLLPVRAVKKREMGRQYLVVAVFGLVVALGGNFYWFYSRDADLTLRQTKLADTNRRIEELQKVIGEVNNINKRKKEVQEKLDVLEQLRKKRSGPVRLLDALATCIPKKVWLSDFAEAQNNVKLNGQAESHEDVSEFMKGLSNIVWTPRGMGRVVERKRDSPTVRVELLTGEGAMEDFPIGEVGNFFTNVELKSSVSASPGLQRTAGPKLVKFEITMGANYAI